MLNKPGQESGSGGICGPDRSDPRWLPGGSSEIPTMIGSFIRKKRKEKGLTQKDLAKRMNVTQGQISQWENSRMLQMSTVEKIALALDCSFASFISEFIVLYDTFEIDLEQHRKALAEIQFEDDIGYCEHLLASDPYFPKILNIYGNLTNEGRLSAYNHLMELEKIPEYQWNNQKKEKD